jgi:hypothetical protein
LFDFFKKKNFPGQRGLEQVIFDIAEHHREADNEILYRMMMGREVFLPIDPTSISDSTQLGKRVTVQQSDNFQIPNVTGPNGQHWIPVATNHAHPMVSKCSISMSWSDVLEMVLKFPESDGLYLQGEKSWLAFDRERVGIILNLFAA